MTIELGGMPMLLDVRGNPVLYEGDVVAIQFLRSYEDIQRGPWKPPWRQPFIVTVVREDGFSAREPFSNYEGFDDDDTESDFSFGTVNIKLLARGGDDGPL